MRLPPIRAVGVVVAACSLLAACRSSGPTPAPSTGTRTSATGSSGPSTGSLPALTSVDSHQITHAYVVFFAGTTSPVAAARLLQHGADFAAALRAQAGSQQAKALTARVTSISRDPQHPSSDVAAVRFDLRSGGQTLLPGAAGYAVRVGGRWVVAARTFCTLLQLQGAAPKACDDAAVIGLPGG